MLFVRRDVPTTSELRGEPDAMRVWSDVLADERHDPRLPAERHERPLRRIVRGDNQRPDLLRRDDLRRDGPQRKRPVHELLHLDGLLPVRLRVPEHNHRQWERGAAGAAISICRASPVTPGDAGMQLPTGGDEGGPPPDAELWIPDATDDAGSLQQ